MEELIYGIHAVQVILQNNPDRVLSVYIMEGCSNKRLQDILHQARRFGISVQYCDRRGLNNKVKSVTHQGVVAKIKTKSFLAEEDILHLLLSCNNKDLLFLVLDRITDPRNLGACLRCAFAFGVDMVIVPCNHSVGLTPVVRKSASGVVDSIPFVRVVNLSRTLKLLQEHNIWVVGTVLVSGKNIFKASLSKRLALVVGSESMGIRCLTKKYCDELITVPMCNSLISLNVAVATGICLFEVLRRRIYTVL